jgi:hypothetical protein
VTSASVVRLLGRVGFVRGTGVKRSCGLGKAVR